MSRRLGQLLLSCLLLVGSAFAAGPAASRGMPSPVVDRAGSWSLRALDGSPATLDVTRPKVAYKFQLPAGMGQGAQDRWLLARLRASVAIAPDQPPGLSYAMVAIDGAVALQIKIDTSDWPTDGIVRWSYLTIETGTVEGQSRSPEFDLDLRNYVQDRSVTPGEHDLEVTIDGGSKVPPPPGLSLKVLEKTGLLLSRRNPYRLDIALDSNGAELFAQRPIVFRYTITNTNPEPYQDVVLTVVDSRSGAVLSGPEKLPTVGRRLSGSLRLPPMAAGKHDLDILWRGHELSARGATRLELDVVSPPPNQDSGLAVLAVVVLALGVFGAIILLRSRR